jgi:hypothetical protein
MLPDAPGTFSMITGWPSEARRRSPMMRPIVSTGPPGGNGTIMVMGRNG